MLETAVLESTNKKQNDSGNDQVSEASLNDKIGSSNDYDSNRIDFPGGIAADKKGDKFDLSAQSQVTVPDEVENDNGNNEDYDSDYGSDDDQGKDNPQEGEGDGEENGEGENVDEEEIIEGEADTEESGKKKSRGIRSLLTFGRSKESGEETTGTKRSRVNRALGKIGILGKTDGEINKNKSTIKSVFKTLLKYNPATFAAHQAAAVARNI